MRLCMLRLAWSAQIICVHVLLSQHSLCVHVLLYHMLCWLLSCCTSLCTAVLHRLLACAQFRQSMLAVQQLVLYCQLAVAVLVCHTD